MEFKKDNNELTILLEKRISSDNSQIIRNEIFNAIIKDKIDKVVLDAKNLEYISSAGLRVILEIGKKYKISVINVSRDVYEIFDISGFTGMFDIKKR